MVECEGNARERAECRLNRKLAAEARRYNREYRPMTREQSQAALRLNSGLRAIGSGRYEGIGYAY